MPKIDGAEHITVVKRDKFRSAVGVNSDYDMVRITLDMPLWVWRSLKKLIENTAELTDSALLRSPG